MTQAKCDSFAFAPQVFSMREFNSKLSVFIQMIIHLILRKGELSVSRPPFNSLMSVSPEEGTAMSTSFFISTRKWMTEPGRIPLYSMVYKSWFHFY